MRKNVPADQTTQSGLTLSKIFFASSSFLTSSRLSTSTSIFPGPFPAALMMASFCPGSRMTEVRFHERDMILRVRRRAILPWPPRRRICGDEGGIFNKTVTDGCADGYEWCDDCKRLSILIGQSQGHQTKSTKYVRSSFQEKKSQFWRMTLGLCWNFLSWIMWCCSLHIQTQKTQVEAMMQ